MDNRLDYYVSKVERQLDFHRGLHLFEMETNPNFTNKAVFLKESQNEYITNLFGNNKTIRESYEREFNSNVIIESTFNPKNEVDKFFSFLKESFVKEVTKSNILFEEGTPSVFDQVKNAQAKISKSVNDYKQKKDDALAKMTPEQKAAYLKSEADIKAKNDKTAYSVVNALKRAFDLDGDNVFDDYDGTNEDDAVKAIDLIVNKNILDKVNQIIGSSIKPYKDLRAWLNDEMSDFDPTQYREIWKRLEGLGYKGANYNDFLAAAGTGVEMVQKGFTWLKEKGLPWFFEKLRDALGSIGGAIVQQLLDYTGVGAIGVTVLWAALTLFDVWQISSGVGSWAKIFFSVIGLLTVGALGAVMGKFLKPFFGLKSGGKLSSFLASIAEKPWFIKYIKPIVGWIGGKISWASGLLKQAGTWIANKLGSTAIGGVVTKAVKMLKDVADNVVKWAGTGAASETKVATSLGIKKLTGDEIKKGGEKLMKKAIYDPAKDYTKEKGVDVAGYVGGKEGEEIAKSAVDLANVKKITGDLKGSIKSGNVAKTVEGGYKTYDEFGNIIDKETPNLANNATNAVSKGNAEIKKVTNYIQNPNWTGAGGTF
jgi:hypothetical protein